MDVLVDLDGTLVDPKPGLIGLDPVRVATSLGAPVPPIDDLAWADRAAVPTSSFPKLLGTTDRTEEAIAHYREHYRNGAHVRRRRLSTAFRTRWTRCPLPAAG